MQSSRVKLNPSFWSHDSSIPLNTDLSRVSIFEKNAHYLVLDLETKTLVDAVGGWKNFKDLEVSIACAYDSQTESINVYREEELGELIKLCQERLVVGYNSEGFDLPILEKYGLTLNTVDSFDLMLDVQNITGMRFLKLEKLAKGTLGVGKLGDGEQAVQWWNEGRVEDIIQYCKQDVIVTRDIFHHGRSEGYIVLEKKTSQKTSSKSKVMEKVEYPVDWR